MVKLYSEQSSSKADRIEAEFHDIILGYDREIITLDEAYQHFDAEHLLSIITNNQKIVSGDSIPAYIEKLRTLMQGRQAFQGDWCYVNNMGNAC